MTTKNETDRLCINTIRALAADMIQQANSGHPGLPLGAAPMAHVLFTRHLTVAPAQPDWADRDRFVLSAGHGSSMLYALLHLGGFPLTMADLKAFRQWESLTPGHPEAHLTAGVEATTGPLGQGFTNAVGMAIAERALAHTFNRPGYEIVDHTTYTLLGDGCIMEGVAMEAASLAGHLKLGKLIALYDANDITLDGPLAMHFSEDVAARFEAHGWQVITVADGNEGVEAIDRALAEAKAETGKPSLLVVKTTIGFGAPKEGTSGVHGAPLGVDGVRTLKERLGLDPEALFAVPESVREAYRRAMARGNAAAAEWESLFARYAEAHPDLAAAWQGAWSHQYPAGWDADLPTGEAGQALATRSVGGKILNTLAARISWLLGGDADLGSSTKTRLVEEADFDGTTGAGRNIHYGVREHAMAAVANGIAYHGGLRNFVSTFFVFSDYMRPAIRLAAMNHLPVTYVWTHDSVAVGEDGPTHQPVEHLMALRTIPNLTLLRPADAHETAASWRVAMSVNDRPVGLVLSRQNMPVLSADLAERAEAGVARGAYVLRDSWEGAPDAILLATGSEVHVALAAQEKLSTQGVHVRVVSMPSWDLFAAQEQAYRDEVLPPEVTARVAIEAGVTFGWERWVGTQGVALGIDRFGASAPGEEALMRLGMNYDAVVTAVRSILD